MRISVKKLRELIQETISPRKYAWKNVSVLPRDYSDYHHDYVTAQPKINKRHYEYWATDAFGDIDSDDPEKPRYVRMADTNVSLGGETFDKIGKELGLTPAGAKRLVAMTLEKASEVQGMLSTPEGVEDFEEMVESAFEDYVKYLASSKELTRDEIEELQKNYDLVIELDGFREYLDRRVRQEMMVNRGVTKLGPPKAKRPGLYSKTRGKKL